MDQFTDSLKALKKKIVEKSVNECIGCVLGEVDDSQHFCRTSMVENTERCGAITGGAVFVWRTQSEA